MCGIYLNRGRIVILIFSIPIIMLMVNADPILEMIQFEEKTTEEASIYICNMAPALIMQALFDINR